MSISAQNVSYADDDPSVEFLPTLASGTLTLTTLAFDNTFGPGSLILAGLIGAPLGPTLRVIL